MSSCTYEPVAGMVNRPIPDSFVKREKCVGVENGIPKEEAIPWMGKRLTVRDIGPAAQRSR